jgi:probable rRNA maturation factor
VAFRNLHPRLRIRPADVRRLVRELDSSGLFAAPLGELSIVVLEEPRMASLHGRFLDDPTETDVITFEGDPDLGLAGEIFVCADVASSYVDGDHERFPAELCLYIVHGYLHLAGFDDTSPILRRAMRAAEKRAMTVLASVDAIPTASLISI